MYNYIHYQVEEFSKVAYVKQLTAIEGHGFLIVWRWVEQEEDEEDPETDAGYVQEEGESLSTESDLEDGAPTELSTVTFKCVGVTRDPVYQAALGSARKLIQEGLTVPVKLVPEPNNPFDSRAISFQCYIDNSWKIIGYLVKEVCDSVHEALQSNSVVSTNFAWVKYKIVRTTGPGYYAAVDVTRKGMWPSKVKQSANTMH